MSHQRTLCNRVDSRPVTGPLESARQVRLDSLTTLRWWAAFGVFAHHILNIGWISGPLNQFARFGSFGVTFFFVLSGFVLTWSWRATVNKRTFYWRRFARIYPLTVVTFVLALPVFYSFHPDPTQPWVKPVDFGILLLALLLLQGWSRDPVVLFAGNPAAWTLTVEAFFYAMHPFVTLVLKRFAARGALIAASCVVAFTFALRIAASSGAVPWLDSVPWPLLRFPEFVLGMCLAWAMRNGWRPRIHVAIPMVLIGAWFSLLILLRHYPRTTGTYAAVAPYTSEIVIVLCALMIVAAATAELRGGAKILRARVTVLLGDWSYAFYLIHATLIYAALEIVGRQAPGWPTLLWATMLLGASIVAAWLLHAFIERPVEKRMRAWQDRRNDRQTPSLTSTTT